MDYIENAKLVENFKKARNKIILLDYDGTLVNYDLIPKNAKLSEQLNEILIKLIEKPQLKVIIISGRGYQDIDKLLVHLPIDIVAEHGAMMKEKGVWTNQINNDDSWKKTIINMLNQITFTCPESYIEEKKFSLAWHYRNAEPQSGYAHSRELIRLLEKEVHSFNLKILDGNKVVEILTNENGKGEAVKKLTGQISYDFILSVGDDTTDEEMFEFFQHNANAYTIKVGNGDTYAKNKVSDINDVILLLKQLSQ
jgi:trehalose 6-phosphate synthase/phosphatase